MHKYYNKRKSDNDTVKNYFIINYLKNRHTETARYKTVLLRFKLNSCIIIQTTKYVNTG